jgi:hypothetical protein
MIPQELMAHYKAFAKEVSKKLEKDNGWIKTYGSYAKSMLKNRDNFVSVRRLFNQCPSLRLYLTIGNTKDNNKIFDIRFLGQSVGTVNIDKNGNVLLTVNKESNKKYFGYDEVIDKADWRKSQEAKKFRKFFKNCKELPCVKEHMVESALFAELGKKQSNKELPNKKTLCHITPISFAGTRIHMKTALKASDAKEGIVKISDKYAGGEIDLFCRRKTGNKARLVVIEIKDGNKTDESFNLAMKQAISYAVFISKLIHSEAGENWMKIWGMENQRKIAEKRGTGYTIDCVVAMPDGVTKPDYNGDILTLDNGDELALHYISIENYTKGLQLGEDVKFKTSLPNPSFKCK